MSAPNGSCNPLTRHSRYLMMQALAELTVLYPINGAFCMYICRFVDPSFGFACAWEYAISWLTVLPFEISAACNIVSKMKEAWKDYGLTQLADSLLVGNRGYQQRRLDCPSSRLARCHSILRCQGIRRGMTIAQVINPSNKLTRTG